MENEDRKRGRPQVWENTRERQQEYRRRKAEVARATTELILAVINAKLEDPELQQQINAAQDDLTVLWALSAYYRQRNWNAGTGARVLDPPQSAAMGTDLQKPLDDNQRRVQRRSGSAILSPSGVATPSLAQRACSSPIRASATHP